jgi:hypothetical protein
VPEGTIVVWDIEPVPSDHLSPESSPPAQAQIISTWRTGTWSPRRQVAGLVIQNTGLVMIEVRVFMALIS